MDLRSVTVIVTLLVGSGGLLGGVYALLKLRPEAGQITVSTAQGVLIMQTTVIDDLTARNERLQSRVDALEAENSSLMTRLHTLESENADLRRRLDDVEYRLSKLLAQG